MKRILVNAGEKKLREVENIVSKLEKADKLYWWNNYFGVHEGLWAEFDTNKPEQKEVLKELYNLGFRVNAYNDSNPRTVSQAMKRLLKTREIFQI